VFCFKASFQVEKELRQQDKIEEEKRKATASFVSAPYRPGGFEKKKTSKRGLKKTLKMEFFCASQTK